MRPLRSATALVVALAVLLIPATASAAIKIHRIQFDPPGSDTGSNPSLNKEFVVLKNTGSSPVTITGWTVRDTSAHVYKFEEFTINAGTKVTIHSGQGNDTKLHLYWDFEGYVWNNDGDTATLKRKAGSKADSCSYSGAGSSVTC